MRTILVVSSLLASAFFAGCIGNSSGDCDTGDLCICDGIGNCDKSCPDGNCTFACRGIGNCNIDCPGGGCSVSCEGTGNCILDCAGGDCDILCRGTGNCICDTCESPADGGRDGGSTNADGGTMPGVDAGMSIEDGGGDTDAGMSTEDGGSSDTDGGMSSDAGDSDAGTPDDGGL